MVEILNYLEGEDFAKNYLPLGYHQAHMEPINLWKLHVKTTFGTYYWLVIPFHGITNFPSTFV